MMTIAESVSQEQITNSTKPLSIVDTTVRKQVAGVMNCMRQESAAGKSTNNGGMKMRITGVMTMIGMIVTTSIGEW